MLLMQSPFSERGNMSVKSIPSQRLHNGESTDISIFTPRYVLTAIFGFIYILSLLLNLRVIYAVYCRFSSKVKTRFSVSILVAHLSIICIGITILSVLNTCQSDGLLELLGPRVCQVSDFLKDSFICGFSLNTVLLVYERVRSISAFDDSLHIFRIIGILWSLASTQGFFTMGLTYHMKLELYDYKLGAQIAGVTCEIIRFLIFHMGVGIYISYALVKVHFKLRRLPVACQRLKAKIENIRFLYIHFCIFIIVWISYGVWCTAVRFAFFLKYDLELYSSLMDYIELGFHTYLAINPMIHVLLMDNEVTSCPHSYLCIKGHYKRDEHFEEDLATGIFDDDTKVTVGVTSPGAIQESKSNGFSTLVRVLSASPRKYGRFYNNPPPQLYVQKVHFVDTLEIQYIDEESEEEISSDEGEHEVHGKQKNMRFGDDDDVAYYEEDHLDDSEETSTSGEYDTRVYEEMETTL